MVSGFWVPHLSGLVFERCGFKVNFMLEVDRFGNASFGSPTKSTAVHKSDRWQQNGARSFIASFTGGWRALNTLK